MEFDGIANTNSCLDVHTVKLRIGTSSSSVCSRCAPSCSVCLERPILLCRRGEDAGHGEGSGAAIGRGAAPRGRGPEEEEGRWATRLSSGERGKVARAAIQRRGRGGGGAARGSRRRRRRPSPTRAGWRQGRRAGGRRGWRGWRRAGAHGGRVEAEGERRCGGDRFASPIWRRCWSRLQK